MKQCIDVPLGWQRLIKSESVVYITPSKSELKSKEDVFVYLTSPGTCKCGLKCPLHLDSLFSFDLSIKSKNLLKVQTQNGQNDAYKSLQNRSKENEHVKIETSVPPVKHSCGLDLVINGNDTSIKAVKSIATPEKEYLTNNNLRAHHPNVPADAISYDDLKSPSPAIKNRPKNQAQTVRSPYHMEPLPSMSVFCKINQTSVEDILNSFTRRNHHSAPAPTIQMEVDTPEKMISNKPQLVTNPPKDNKSSVSKSSPTTQAPENYSPMMYNTNQMSHLERQHQAQLEYMMQYQMYQQYRLNNNKGKASSESYGDNMTIQSMYHSQRQAEFMRMHQKMQQQTNAQQNNTNPSHPQRSAIPANAANTKPTNPPKPSPNPSTSAAPPASQSTDPKLAQHPRNRQNNLPEMRVQQSNSRSQQKHQPEQNSQSRPVYDLKNQIQFTVPSFNQGQPAGASGYQYQGVLKPHAFMQQSDNQERNKNPSSKSKNPKSRPPPNSKMPSKHPPDLPRNVVDPPRVGQDPNNPNNKPMLVISTNQDHEPPKKSAKMVHKKVSPKISSENCLTSVDSILKTCSNLNIGSFKDIDKDPGKKPDPKQHLPLPTPTEGVIPNIISTPKSQVQQNVANIAPAYGIVRMQYLTPVHQVSVLPSNVVSLPVVLNPPKAEEPEKSSEKWEGVLSPSEVDAKVQKMLSSPQKIEDHHVVSHEKESDPKKRKRQQSAPHMYDRYPGNPSLRFQTTGSQKTSKSSSKSEGSDLSPVFRPVVKPNWPQFVQQAPTVSSSAQFIPVSQTQVIINPTGEEKGVRKIHPKS